ncbi:hypothetical protein UB51_18840 [Paenibacillus sp. IHBB 10380]|uniref:hypothetical protein n=1 Tax=Paenibacillus sp. IHBB 10380 TaxID=1566358 RepID=UPI0005CFBCBB|nr:hypothetical protein [Paenibacillus sp. IHBB 10380]AJS61630.1 hypothetical protein UB51_18840 [Paenibacillus sp. IHBB 10380]
MGKLKPLGGALIGYLVGLVCSSFLPDFLFLLFPIIGGGLALLLGNQKNTGQKTHNIPDVIPVQEAVLNSSDTSYQSNGIEASKEKINPMFQPIIEYLEVIEDMVISEGQQNTLDNEIVEKSCSLFLRLHRVIPLLSDLNNDEINHTINRLVLKELNSVINPFLRLSGEAKIKNRRVLLNGIRDVNNKISDIVATIEHKDLLELQTRAEVIHKRYANS